MVSNTPCPQNAQPVFHAAFFEVLSSILMVGFFSSPAFFACLLFFPPRNLTFKTFPLSLPHKKHGYPQGNKTAKKSFFPWSKLQRELQLSLCLAQKKVLFPLHFINLRRKNRAGTKRKEKNQEQGSGKVF